MIAYKMRIIDLVNGKLKNDEMGGFILSTPFGESKEARILGTIIDSYKNSENTYGSFTIDDGTATTRLKAWSEKIELLDKYKVGEIVDIIGRVGEFQDEIYIVPETIIPATPNYWLYRELDLSKRIKELMERGLSFEYKEKIDTYAPPEPEVSQKEEKYDEVTEEVTISEVEEDLQETEIEELMEEVSEEASKKEITEEKGEMSFYEDIDEEEIKDSVFSLLMTDPKISKSEISNVLSIDELDVELAIKDLIDEGRIKSKEDGFEISE